MSNFDSFLNPYWDQWQHVEAVTITQAACLLTLNDPSRHSSGRVLPSEADAMATAIQQAILLRRLPPFAAWAYDPDYGQTVAVAGHDLSPHLNLLRDSTIRVSDLAAWCDSKGIQHCWSALSANDEHEKPTMDIGHYPGELRAAIEAFNAVSANPTAIAGRSPRTAIVEWLESHKPEIGANARERIATVANWQPAGGAPKTPGA